MKKVTNKSVIPGLANQAFRNPKPVWGLQFLSHVTLGHGDSCIFFCALTVQSKDQGAITLRELLYPKLGHNSKE